MNAALARYHIVCDRYATYRTPFEAELAETWQALPLRTRLRIILTPSWRDAVHEVRQHFRRTR